MEIPVTAIGPKTMNFFTLRFPIVSVIREPQRFIPRPKDNRTRPRCASTLSITDPRRPNSPGLARWNPVQLPCMTVVGGSSRRHQQLIKQLLRWQWPPEEIALIKWTGPAFQIVKLFRRFDTLRHDPQLVVVRDG